MSNVSAGFLVGSTLGDKYVIEALLGEGAMGAVYRAHQIALHRTVAVKVLHQRLAVQSTFVQRFQREAFSASRLDHPNSLRVLDFGQSDDLLYLVMEYFEGEDLVTVMEKEWPLDNRRVVEIMSQALSALSTAHELGIIHRDVKPGNILISRGTDDEGKPVDVVKMCDFGIAKITVEKSHSFSRHLTTEGFVLGTPDYMSPEQARGVEIDGRSDLYSMGVVLYQLLVGELPFAAETPLGVVLRHISDPPPPPSSNGRKVHPRLEAICMRALAKDPRDRFENAREMRRALRVALDGDDAPAISAPVPAGGSTDMTSVPVSGATPKVQTGARLWTMVRSFRAPAMTRGRAALLVGAAVSTGGVLFLMRQVSTRAEGGEALANRDTVLTSPLPPVAESPAAPTGGPSIAPGEPLQASARASDRAQSAADRRRNDKSGGRASAVAAAGGEATHGGAPDGDAVRSPIASSRAEVRQPPSLPSNDPVAAPASPPREGAGSPATEPAARAPVPPAPPPPVAANPVPPSAPPVLDPSHASVSIGAITTTGGISSSKVRVALARIPFTSCYRGSLAKVTSAAPMEASLRINVDLSGRVTGATLSSDGSIPGLRACIESEARALTLRDVDTGDGSAVVTLTFAPR